jgi:hypothetical protein
VTQNRLSIRSYYRKTGERAWREVKRAKPPHLKHERIGPRVTLVHHSHTLTRMLRSPTTHQRNREIRSGSGSVSCASSAANVASLTLYPLWIREPGRVPFQNQWRFLRFVWQRGATERSEGSEIPTAPQNPLIPSHLTALRSL